jgi:enterochelin esterase-like enzyme
VSLTGPALLAIVSLSTVAAFVAAVVLMPLIRGNRWLVIGSRAMALLMVNAFVLLSAAIAFNDHYQFYADWTDLGNSLFGSGRLPSITLHAGARGLQDVHGSGLRRRHHIRNRTHGVAVGVPAGGYGRIPVDTPLSYEVTGRRSGLTGQILVTVPPGYDEAANAHRRYPVIETFPGYPATPEQWFTDMNLGGALRAAEQAGRIAPAITISPQTEVPGGIDNECVNGPGADPKAETWLTSDVRYWAEHHFRVRTDRTSWTTLGLSAGAWCAAMLTMLHPSQYAAGIVMAGYFEPKFSHTYEPFAPGSPQARHYDLVALAHADPPPVALWIGTSRADDVSYPSSSRLLAAARPPLSIEAVVLLHAGHRFAVWTPLLPRALSWLGATVPGFRAIHVVPAVATVG